MGRERPILHVVDEPAHCGSDSPVQILVTADEARHVGLVEAKHVVEDQDLPVAAGSGTDADGGYPQPLRDHVTQLIRDTLQDGSEGPEMVVIPAGEFWMGSDKEQDPAAEDDELPRHTPHFMGVIALVAIGNQAARRHRF